MSPQAGTLHYGSHTVEWALDEAGKERAFYPCCGHCGWEDGEAWQPLKSLAVRRLKEHLRHEHGSLYAGKRIVLQGTAPPVNAYTRPSPKI